MTKPSVSLNCFLAKSAATSENFQDFLAGGVDVTEYPLDQALDLSGTVFVKNNDMGRPLWAPFLDFAAGVHIDQLNTISSSAVFFVRAAGRILVFAFGYGRHLLNLSKFEPDFGIKTALNTLDHENLIGVDLHTLDDKPIQKKSQATMGSEVRAFGIDVSKDVLRAATGKPIGSVAFSRISGGDAMFSFTKKLVPSDLKNIASEVLGYYNNNNYKKTFGWVDNIRKIRDSGSIERLDRKLVADLKKPSPRVIVTIPEVLNWDDVDGFSFTRGKQNISPIIESDEYFTGLDKKDLSIDKIKRDRLFIFDCNGQEHPHPIYKCLYFEIRQKKVTYIIFGGIWYEIDTNFVDRVEAVLSEISESTIAFPSVKTWKVKKKDKMVAKIESEGDYNTRAAKNLKFHLLDKQLVKTSRSTTSIELCDLLTSNKQFIHAKHRKGGSAGLSHLFAQGNVSASLMLGDKAFRKKARIQLRKVNPAAQKLVPLNKISSDEYEIVFLVLGEKTNQVIQNLPLFSKVNLSHAYESLSQRGFKVSVAGAEKIYRKGT